MQSDKPMQDEPDTSKLSQDHKSTNEWPTRTMLEAGGRLIFNGDFDLDDFGMEAAKKVFFAMMAASPSQKKTDATEVQSASVRPFVRWAENLNRDPTLHGKPDCALASDALACLGDDDVPTYADLENPRTAWATSTSHLP